MQPYRHVCPSCQNTPVLHPPHRCFSWKDDRADRSPTVMICNVHLHCKGLNWMASNGSRFGSVAAALRPAELLWGLTWPQDHHRPPAFHWSHLVHFPSVNTEQCMGMSWPQNLQVTESVWIAVQEFKRQHLLSFSPKHYLIQHQQFCLYRMSSLLQGTCMVFCMLENKHSSSKQIPAARWHRGVNLKSDCSLQQLSRQQCFPKGNKRSENM